MEPTHTEQKRDDTPPSPVSCGDAVLVKEDSDDESSSPVQKIPVAPILSLRQGLSRKASPLALKSWVGLALTLDGRDKITKVFQYATRFLAFWFAGTNHQARFQSMQAKLTQSRKAYRLGRSLIEIEKIRSSGLLELLLWYLRPKKVVQANAGTDVSQLRTGSTRPTDAPLWKLLGNTLKMLGLLGFWAGDNVNFLAGGGLLDNYSLPAEERTFRRKRLQKVAAETANRCYYAGAIAGLFTNLRVYLSFRRSHVRPAMIRFHKAEEVAKESARQELEKIQERQFSLFVALLKSCCDVIVFSNNPGVDLVETFRGKKTPEPFHCLCGLVSASTVLYNNFPNAKK